jgi:hypothetical protein
VEVIKKKKEAVREWLVELNVMEKSNNNEIPTREEFQE